MVFISCLDLLLNKIFLVFVWIDVIYVGCLKNIYVFFYKYSDVSKSKNCFEENMPIHNFI